ncbi:hypothetical protein ABBQ32_009504 [Trebouxia sp. C0010 RCD-2024]
MDTVCTPDGIMLQNPTWRRLVAASDSHDRMVVVSGWLTLCKARKHTAACSSKIMTGQPSYYASQMELHNVQAGF